MRITGGRARSIVLKTPVGRHLRPATDKMRQAVFSYLGKSILGAYFLDVFAGTGAYGLEALSRGAKGGIFVEQDRRTTTALRANLSAVARSLNQTFSACGLVKADALRWMPQPSCCFDLVFADPPYAVTAARSEALFSLFHRCLSVQQSARLIVEMPAALDLCPTPWKIERRLGSRGTFDPSVVIYRKMVP